MEPAPGAQVEEPGGLPCPECGDIVTPKGKMSAAMALGLHRKTEHGVAGRKRNAARRKPGAASAPAEPEAVTPTALKLVHSAADDASRGKSAPNAESLAKGAGRVYGYVGYFVSALMVEGDPRLTTEAQREEVASALAPTPQEAVATMHPLARVFAGTQLNRRYGSGFIENLDVADCLVAVGEQVRRWRSYMASRHPAPSGGAFGAGVPVGPPAAGTPAPPFVNPDAPAGVPPNPMMGGYQGPERGVVVDADMVAAMRRGEPIPWGTE